MKSHEAIAHALKKTSPKQVSSDLGVSLSLIYKWSQPQDDLGSGSRNPLDRINRLHKTTGDDTLIQWICHQAGGYFVKNPPPDVSEEFDVMPATNSMIGRFADLLTTISDAAEDQSIGADEAAEIRQIWNELKSYTEGFVTCCEEGDFDPIRKANSRQTNAR